MDSSWNAAYRVARRHYELGRIRDAGVRASIVTLLTFVVTALAVGHLALVWLPLTLAVTAFAEWYGRQWMKGVRRGVAFGFVSLVVPLSILRPCCASNVAPALSSACCTMPAICWITGGMLGLGLSLAMPKDAREHRFESALAMLLGVTSVTVARCSALFIAEAIGLLGGLAAGVVAASAARAVLERARQAA
jgi:hypothetical protein